MEKYKFVRYTGFYPRGDTKIALHKSGVIRLSSGFCRVNVVLSYQYAILFYDASNKAIAFQFTNHRSTGAVKITKDRNGAAISGTAFMKSHGLNLKNYAGRYDWKKEMITNIGEVFIIDLNKK